MRKNILLLNFLLLAPLLVHAELRWYFDKIDYSYKALISLFLKAIERNKKPFVFGGASSAYQNEGVEGVDGKPCENNWTADSTKPNPGNAAGSWRFYKKDIQCIEDMGFGSYRISLEWSKIEPKKGVFDPKAMQHYIDVIDEMLKKGIKPVICLFHHTWPAWFKGFEHRDTSTQFKRFATHVMDQVGQRGNKVDWLPFNEPEGYALEGYFRGHYPPGKQRYPRLERALMPRVVKYLQAVTCKVRTRLGYPVQEGSENTWPLLPQGLVRLVAAGYFLRNCLWTHVEIADELRKRFPQAQIGIVKVMNPIEPYHCWNPIERAAAKTFDHLLNDVMLNFFATGSFNWLGIIKETNKKAPISIDYVGISYYTHTLLKQELNGSISAALKPGEKASDSGKALYAEGLYRSIKKVAAILPKKYIVIAENGLSDEKDVLRDEYIRKHLYAVGQAMLEGCDVRGYFTWSLTDTFNWNHGFNSKYGLFAVNFDDPEKKRTMRPSAEKFRDFIKEFDRDQAQLKLKNNWSFL